MLIDAATLYELLIFIMHINTARTKTLADSLFELYNDTMSSLSSTDISYGTLYISICKDIISQQLNITDNRSDIMNLTLRYLSSRQFKNDTFIKESLHDLVKSKVTAARLSDISKKLNNLVMWHRSKAYNAKIYSQLQECKLAYSTDDQTERIDHIKRIVGDFKTTLLDLDSVAGRGGPVEVINFSERNSIKGAIDLFRERSVTHVLRTGLQGLNRMCGPRGGFALGESVVFCSITHNYKSGMLMNIAKWIADYSTPPRCDNKKPLILFVTLENIGYMNMMDMFKQMYASLTGGPPDESITGDDLVNTIYEYFNRGEYTLVIERYLPDALGYDELVRLVEKYENSGFKVVATIVDYLAQMKTTVGSVSRSGDHVLLQELYNKTCNYFKAIGTTLFTAHQLNRGASDIVATGCPHPVKHFSERHLAGSIGVGREVDFMCFMHIERDEQGGSWLTMSWGKHRYVTDTPEAHKFVAYKFSQTAGAGIIDDVGKKYAGTTSIYKETNSKTNHGTIEEILGIKGKNNGN